MKTSTVHIEKPSKKLLATLSQIQADKEATKKDMRANWDKYFPKRK